MMGTLVDWVCVASRSGSMLCEEGAFYSIVWGGSVEVRADKLVGRAKGGVSCAANMRYVFDY